MAGAPTQAVTSTATAGSPRSPSADAPRTADPAEDAALRLGAAWSACDRAAGLALSLTYEEVSALTNKKVDRKDWDSEQRDAFDQRCRELTEAHARVLAAKVMRTEHHDPQSDSDLKADVDIAFVQYVFEQNGQASMRGSLVTFVKTPSGFKFIAKH
jgi:hypothetical protein